MFKRILVAVDGSHTADLALQEAIKLAKELQAQLRIVHAVDIVNINLGAEFPDPSEISDAMTKSGQEILRKAEAVARDAGIAVETTADRNRHHGPPHPGNDRGRRRSLAGRPYRDLHAWPQGAEPPVPGQRRRGCGARRHETGAADPRKMTVVRPGACIWQLPAAPIAAVQDASSTVCRMHRTKLTTKKSGARVPASDASNCQDI